MSGDGEAEPRPPMRVSGPVLDAANPVELARFYERLLGWTMTDCEGPRPGFPPEDGWARLRSPSGDLKLEFQWEQHYVRPVWPPVPGEPQMMLHLDILVEDLDAGVAWALESGATVAEHQPQRPGDHVIMLDPEGHPFCMCRGAV
jgi:predicted enzyme related to lactoylglutathione lyase